MLRILAANWISFVPGVLLLWITMGWFLGLVDFDIRIISIPLSLGMGGWLVIVIRKTGLWKTSIFVHVANQDLETIQQMLDADVNINAEARTECGYPVSDFAKSDAMLALLSEFS